ARSKSISCQQAEKKLNKIASTGGAAGTEPTTRVSGVVFSFFSACCFLFGSLVVQAVRRGDGSPISGLKARIGSSIEEACGKGGGVEVAVTGRDGSFRVERPIGKAVIAFDPDNYAEVWIGLDQEVEVVFQF